MEPRRYNRVISLFTSNKRHTARPLTRFLQNRVSPCPNTATIQRVSSTFLMPLVFICTLYPTVARATTADSILNYSSHLASLSRYRQAEQVLLKHINDYHNNSKVVGNAIVYAYLSGNYTIAEQIFSRVGLTRIPEYARHDLIESLRNIGAYKTALFVLRHSHNYLSLSNQLLYIALLAESHSAAQALQRLSKMRSKANYNIDQLDMVAYIYRLLGKPMHALQYSTEAWTLSGNHDRSSFREVVFSLEDARAYYQALTLARQHPMWFSKRRMNYFIYNANAEYIDDSKSFKQHLANHGFLFGTNRSLRSALIQNINNDNKFRHEKSLLLLSYYNEWIALDDIGNLPRVLSLYRRERIAFPSLRHFRNIPNYALEPLAAAYLHEHHPKRAISLYKHIMLTSKHPSINTIIGLYYSYISAEEYNKADVLLHYTALRTPPWRWAQAPARYRKPNWAWLQIHLLVALNMAYRNHLMECLRRLTKLHTEAPENVGITNDLVTALRWAGFFDKANRTLRSARQLKPDAIDTILNTAELAHEYHHTHKWGESISVLHRAFPFNNQISRHYLNYRDRHMPTISVKTFVGHSTGAGSLPSGNQDSQDEYRVQSGWIYSNYTIFAGQHYAYSQYNHGSVSLNRSDFGLMWQRNRSLLEFAISQKQLTGGQLGLNIRAAQWFNDHLYLSLHFNSYTNQIPLRAYRAGLTGKRLSTTIQWRTSPDLNIAWHNSVMLISDGNTRIDNLISFNKSIWNAPHQLLRGHVTLWNENNSEHGVPYFNPSIIGDVDGGLHYKWIIWRRYGTSLSQIISASGGLGWQSQFSTYPVFDVRYLQQWVIHRNWAIRYGLGFTGANYDGAYGQTLYGLAQLRGRI